MCHADAHTVAHEFLPYKVVRCRSCDLHYLSPRLSEAAMQRIYEDDSYFEDGEVGYTSYLEQEASLRYSFGTFLRQLQKRSLTGGDLLEVGCGHGFFLESARPYFQRCVGVDFSPAVVASARSRANQVYQGGIESIPRSETYDCIVLISVIEHVHEPVDFLRTLRTHLRPSGRLIVATPDVSGVFQRMLGRRWPAYQVIPEHVAFYNRHTLSSLMTKAGLTRVTAVPYMRAYPAHLVVEEFNLWPAIMKRLGRRNLVFPGYMVALCGTHASSTS
jgi:2-polyprenyl-3-methyl-5-hydroxy-6-metoxy-1,4-benzoquinol methylase